MLDNLSGATRLFPVVGDPIGQVKSPYGVTKAFEARGADAICIPMQVRSTDWQLYMQLMRAMPNVDGVIVTVPHKFAAFDSCDHVSERARFLRTVNCMRRRPDGSFEGDMFDGLGFVAACETNGCRFVDRRALLIGTGGAGTAIAHAVATVGVKELALCDLDHRRRDELVARLRQEGLPVVAADNDATAADIVLNATPLGMRAEDPLPIRPGSLRSGQFVGDVVTKPEIPPLIVEARRLGLGTSNGVAMFEKVRDLMIDFLLRDMTKAAGQAA